MVSNRFKHNFNRWAARLCGAFFLLPPAADVLKDDFINSLQTNVLETTFEQGDEYFKTPHELDAFFIKTKGFKNSGVQAYFKSYKPLLLSSSKTFELPFSFQSCLIFKESRFDKKAVSAVGALGVAQFMEDTYSFLSKALKAGEKTLHTEGRDILSAEEFEFFEDPNLAQLSSMKMQREIYKKMYLRWQKYLDENDLEEINLARISYKKTLRNPDYAIGLSSMYLFYLKQRVELQIQDKASSDDMRSPEFFLSVAGAYNQGARRLFKAVKRNQKSPKFSKWISYQSRVKETKNYISSIKTCMKSDNQKKTPQQVAKRNSKSFKKGQKTQL
jgi:hypothetical protein